MAINDGSTNNAQPQPQNMTQPQQPQQPQQPPRNMFSFHDEFLYTTAISRGYNSEYVTDFKTTLTEICKNVAANVQIAIIDMDNAAERALDFSSIVIAMRDKNAGTAVAFHILTLEATGTAVRPLIDTGFNNRTIELHRVTSDTLDDTVINLATKKVQQQFPEGPWYYAEGTVVPETFNAKDRVAMHKLMLNTGLACSIELRMHTAGYNDLNLGDLKKDSSLLVEVTFNNTTREDIVGQPRRGGFETRFSSRKQTGNRNALNAGDKELTISEASGFVDFIRVPSAQGAFNPYANNQPQTTQVYAAVCTITQLSTTILNSPGAVLLALANVTNSLLDNNNWIQTLRATQTAKNEIDIRDVGALNIDCNLKGDPNQPGVRIDTKSQSFSNAELGQFVSAIVRPGMVVALDCPEFGPESYYLSLYADASQGGTNAYNRIYNTAERLCNGNFSKYFALGQAITTNPNNRVHTGTWVDGNGKLRDLRDIDLLAACNLIGKNPLAIRNFSDTFLQTNVPLIQRLADRKALISSMTNESAKFTGYALRVTFTHQFLEALIKGIRDTGIEIRSSSPLSASDFNNQRGVASFIDSALMAPGSSYMVSGGMQYNNTASMPFNQSHGRW